MRNGWTARTKKQLLFFCIKIFPQLIRGYRWAFVPDVVNGTFAKAIALAFHWAEEEKNGVISLFVWSLCAYDVRCHNKCIQKSGENKFNQDWDRSDEEKIHTTSDFDWVDNLSGIPAAATAAAIPSFFVHEFLLFFSPAISLSLHYLCVKSA